MSVLCIRLVLLAVTVLLLSASYDAIKMTQRPKYQYTKKPPREPVQTTTHAAKPTVTARIVDYTKPKERIPQIVTEATTIPAYVDYHSDTTVSPNAVQDNYTLDYNECYFNFCECCPPERGPQGIKGDTGHQGEWIYLHI